MSHPDIARMPADTFFSQRFKHWNNHPQIKEYLKYNNNRVFVKSAFTSFLNPNAQEGDISFLEWLTKKEALQCSALL